MRSAIKQYTQWLHTRWPAGTVEKLPIVDEEGGTNVPGLFVVGDLTGIPLLKFAADTGVGVVQRCHAELAGEGPGEPDVLDLAIIGGGVSGCAAAIEAHSRNLRFELFEASQTFSTLKNFPKGKPIFTYPTDMVPRGDLQFNHQVKEPLVEDLDRQLSAAGIEATIGRVDRIKRRGGILEVYLGVSGGQEPRVVRARRVIIAIGRSGEFRKLGVPGEELGKVSNRLHDPKEFSGKEVVVVGGCDSALETAVALTVAGARVRLSYRQNVFSRAKPENVEMIEALLRDPESEVGIEQPTSGRVTSAITAEMLPAPRAVGHLEVLYDTNVTRIDEETVEITHNDGRVETVDNEAVFTMIGREPPLEFFRKCGVQISGEWNPTMWATLVAFLGFCLFIYHWKSYYWFPTDGFNPANWVRSGLESAEQTSVLYTLLKSASGRASTIPCSTVAPSATSVFAESETQDALRDAADLLPDVLSVASSLHPARDYPASMGGMVSSLRAATAARRSLRAL